MQEHLAAVYLHQLQTLSNDCRECISLMVQLPVVKIMTRVISFVILA